MWSLVFGIRYARVPGTVGWIVFDTRKKAAKIYLNSFCFPVCFVAGSVSRLPFNLGLYIWGSGFVLCSALALALLCVGDAHVYMSTSTYNQMNPPSLPDGLPS
jgi:hypothetical protein